MPERGRLLFSPAAWQNHNRAWGPVPASRHDLIEKSYRDLLAEAQPYWMHPEAAARDMKDLTTLRDPRAVVEAIRHEPEAMGERTMVPMAEADAERVAEAYRRYETYRRQYVAEVMERMDLHGEKAPVQPDVSEHTGDHGGLE